MRREEPLSSPALAGEVDPPKAETEGGCLLVELVEDPLRLAALGTSPG